MEAVHFSKNRSWISDVINLKSFLEEWINQLRFTYPTFPEQSQKSHTKEFLEYMNIKREDLNFTPKECGPEALDCQLENEMLSKKHLVIPPGVDLLTLRLQKQKLEMKMATDNLYYKNMIGDINYLSKKSSQKSSQLTQTSSDTVKAPDILITVQMFRPVSQIHSSGQRRMSPFVLDQQVKVLGCQKLTELRDSINCVSDLTVIGDFSENPDFPQSTRAKDIYKSGFFFFNNTFYIDMRNENNRDYSDVIEKWAQDPSRGIGPFQKKVMEDTNFIDLDIQLGYPYVYLHQGYCEHLIVFKDIRLIHPDDSHLINHYPMYEETHSKKSLHCMICENRIVRWITYNNTRLPYDPFFFCNACFRSFNYTVDGQKIGEFQAYPYYDRTAVV
ncbi:snRNA-activating protein complex subunit 3-like isoform X1 [Centruroides sculpturatus]|uniref:snRNA-activating protein complex subunit 3-like isoform X1 n=2 Tax=Centruroides sculpturatus TaxID=218467 RepID=UPI000C6CCB87|nr:snRNA-activating protein complex subunit 3-like isoform X1 [Centruroides sculpturatus]